MLRTLAIGAVWMTSLAAQAQVGLLHWHAQARPVTLVYPTEAASRPTAFGPFTLDVAMNAKTPGYVDVKYKNSTFTMKPVLSSTGALRLEDVTGRTLMLQIANKSMLMDTKIGQRMVDNCVHPNHIKVAATN